MKRIDSEFLPGLNTIFSGWNTFPTPAKRALLDMAYNLGLRGLRGLRGIRGLRKFQTPIGHVGRREWEKAADACARKGIPDGRNEWTKACFRAAMPPDGVR